MNNVNLGASQTLPDHILRLRSSAEQIFTLVWKIRKRAIVSALDLGLATFSYFVAIYLLEGFYANSWRDVFWGTLPPLLACRLLGLASTRLTEGSLRYPGISESLNVVRAVTASSLLFVAWTRMFHFGLPPALFVMDAAVLACVWAALHCGARAWDAIRVSARRSVKRVIIIGAGDAGMSLIKELSSDPATPCRPVAILDDDPSRSGSRVYGVPIVCNIDNLEAVARRYKADEVLICIPSATQRQMSRVLSTCRQANLPVRTLPTLAELVSGKAAGHTLRSLSISDLLNREEVHHNPDEIQQIVRGKIVLITGAGGSIGSELSRQVASSAPAKLLLLDKSENSLFYIHRELHEGFPDVQMRALLIDLTCRHFVEELVKEETPEIIFHAAAHKHVGLIELHPHEGIRNNVLGIRNIAVAALRCGCGLFVNISSDKAVNPRNYMGCSKRITEMLVQDLAHLHLTRFMNVRFGNVAGSTGSVLRLFWDQIQHGGPVLVTDPRATRYFMSIPEAVYLILQAARLGKGGETFVFEMGEPINIYELARSMSLLAGLMPGKEVPIHFVGLQRGEKFAEELWEAWESPLPTPQAGIRMTSEQHPAAADMLNKIHHMEEHLRRNDRKGLCSYLLTLLPQFEKNRREIFLEEQPEGDFEAVTAGSER